MSTVRPLLLTDPDASSYVADVLVESGRHDVAHECSTSRDDAGRRRDVFAEGGFVRRPFLGAQPLVGPLRRRDLRVERAFAGRDVRLVPCGGVTRRAGTFAGVERELPGLVRPFHRCGTRPTTPR